ncbi:MAG: glutaredoxin domain-containing protein [Candidatus Colwellbacteria bacterium]
MVKPIIYTTPTCQFCKMAKAFFAEKGIQYEEKDVASNLEARQKMVEKSGQLGVPVITFGESVVIGFDKNALEHLIEHSKE